MSVQSADPDKMALHAERRRRRLLYSLNDLQQALSAGSFLYDCEEDHTYSRADLRRFRCYETTLIVAYTRPFTQSRGAAAPLTMKMIDLKLTTERQALHGRLVEMRNTIMAHSDSEMMRMTTEAFDVPSRDGDPPLYLIQTVFDEGVTLLGALLNETNELLNEVYNAIYRTLHKEVQGNPKLFNIRIDSPKAKAVRNIRV